MKIIFIHGLESSGSGYKGRFLRKIFPDILTPDFNGTLDERMSLLNNLLDSAEDVFIIGSSFGGVMGTLFALSKDNSIKKLLLFAPALNYFPELFDGKVVDTPTTIYQGRRDEVVPIKDVRTISERLFSNLTFNEVDDDHLLHNTFNFINWVDFYE